MKTLTTIAIAVALTACTKDEPRRVRFTADCNRCTVEYQDASGGIVKANVTAAALWETDVVLNRGDRVYVRVTANDGPFQVPATVWAYLSGDQLATWNRSTTDVVSDSVWTYRIEVRTPPTPNDTVYYWQKFRTVAIDEVLPK